MIWFDWLVSLCEVLVSWSLFCFSTFEGRTCLKETFFIFYRLEIKVLKKHKKWQYWRSEPIKKWIQTDAGGPFKLTFMLIKMTTVTRTSVSSGQKWLCKFLRFKHLIHKSCSKKAYFDELFHLYFYFFEDFLTFSLRSFLAHILFHCSIWIPMQTIVLFLL